MLAKLDPNTLRALMPQFLSGFIRDPAVAATNLARIQVPIAAWSDEVAQGVIDELAALGSEEVLYKANPACKTVARAWSRDLISEHEIIGVEHLRKATESGPTMVLCNHSAYFDSTAIDAMLAWGGHEDLADRLVSAAGPKVYTDLFRRVAAGCINTLPVPQSTSFSHTTQMSPRELARRAINSMKAAGAALDDGYVLLLFPEGSRTRTGTMGPFLRGVHRYLGLRAGLQVIPTALVGTARIMPVGDHNKVRPASASLTFGPPLIVGPDLPQREALLAAHAAISALLPAANRPPESQPVIA